MARRKNCNNGTTPERSVEQIVRVRVEDLKPDLLTRNLALISDADPDYKHMIGLQRGPLPHVKHFSAIKHIHKITMTKQRKRLNGDMK